MNPDSNEISSIEQRLKSCTQALHTLAPLVGAAKQTRQYDSDRRKNALASFMLEHIKRGDSAAAAETMARSDEGFAAKMVELGEQLRDAEVTIAKWDANFASFEASRSLLSMQKETFKTLQG